MPAVLPGLSLATGGSLGLSTARIHSLPPALGGLEPFLEPFLDDGLTDAAVLLDYPPVVASTMGASLGLGGGSLASLAKALGGVQAVGMFGGVDLVDALDTFELPADLGNLLADWPAMAATLSVGNAGGSLAMMLGSVTSLTAPQRTGLPALAVPFGATATGLPLGVQVVGRAFDEATVLRVGLRLEEVWHRQN